MEENSCGGNKCKNDNQHLHDHAHDHAHESNRSTPEGDENKSCWENLKGKGSAGYMNLLGSFIHNFIDGLALGVAFATG